MDRLINLLAKWLNGQNEVVKGPHLAQGPPVEQVWPTQGKSCKMMDRYCQESTSCGSWRSSTCQRRWWCTSTLPSSSPSSPPPSPSGMLLPLLRTRADCSALLRWRLAATFHPFRTCTAPGLWGVQVGLWPTPPIPLTDFWRLSPLAGSCGPSGPKSPATWTVSSLLQLGSWTGPGTLTDTDSSILYLFFYFFIYFLSFLYSSSIFIHQSSHTCISVCSYIYIIYPG